MMFAVRKTILLLPSLMASHSWADTTENQYIVRRSPTMAAFYSVAEDGRSVREVVDTSVITDPHAQPSGTVVTGRPKTRPQGRPEKVSRVTIVISARPKRHDNFAEFRCERYGFYYTSRGDCVVPAASSAYVVGADKPGPAIDKGLAMPQSNDPVFSGRR